MRFPTASVGQVRSVLFKQSRNVAGARRQVVLALVLMVVGAAANIQVPFQLGRIVDVVQGNGSATLMGVALSLLGAALIAAVCSAAGFYVLARVTERLIANLREDVVGTALRLPTHRVEEAGSGDLVSRSTDDVAELSAAVTETIPVLTTSVFSIAATAVTLVSLDWQYLLVVVTVAPIYFFAARRYLSAAPQRYSAERQARAERADRVLEAIRGRETVRAYRLESWMHHRIGSSSRDVATLGFRARRTMVVLQVWMSIAECLMLCTGLVVGFWAVRSATLSPGAVTGAMLMLIRLRGPLMGLMRVLDTVQSGYASLARIVGVVIDPPVPIPDKPAPPRRGHVLMRNVHFSYSEEAASKGVWSVAGIDLEIAPGQVVAVVGPTGAGKTTLAALLAGLRIPQVGTVEVDGVEVSELSDSQRVARLALVSQEVYAFSGTLRHDLTLAKPNATDEELEEALRRVKAQWYEELPDGLDTVIGAHGMALDPVATQQLALARILLLDSTIVIMDEATAEAGSSNAGQLEAAAMEVTRGRTALVIAHRLNQASSADHIIVMDRGRVVEQGTHEALLTSKGQYSRLWEAWKIGRST